MRIAMLFPIHFVCDVGSHVAALSCGVVPVREWHGE